MDARLIWRLDLFSVEDSVESSGHEKWEAILGDPVDGSLKSGKLTS